MPEDILKLAVEAIDIEWIKKHSYALNELERTSANKDFLKSTDYLLKVMEEAGFSDIERYALPCDGETVYDDCVMPLAWERTGRSTLEMVAPENMLLADSAVEPVSSVIWSPPTPAGGVTAELADINSVTSGDWHELAGKIVLWDNSPSPAWKKRLADCGALGIVAYVDSTFDTNPDDVRWMNGVGLRGWYYTKDDPKMWVFSITPRQGRMLRDRLKSGEKIVLKAEMKTQCVPGEIYTVTGVIPGKSSAEHAMVAHLYEPFVTDDAAGAVISVAVGKALKELSQRGAIPPLERGIRVVFSMERYGFSEYFLNPERAGKIISAINMDSICHLSLKLAGVLPELRHSPVAAPYFDTILLRNILKSGFPQVPFEETPGNLSDDTFMADSTYKIPCCWFHTPPAPNLHHNTGAVFNDGDWEIGAAVAALMSCYHAKVACVTPGKAAEELLKEIQEGVFADCAKDFERLSGAEFSLDEKKVISKALIEYHTARVTAFNALLPGSVNAPSIAEALSEKASELQDKKPQLPAGHPMEKMVITRKEFSQLMSFARVPREERYPVRVMPEMLMQSLLDGKRTLREAYLVSNFFLKRVPRENEADLLVETFEFLARYGYYTIVK